jgi:hypothetical protein
MFRPDGVFVGSSDGMAMADVDAYYSANDAADRQGIGADEATMEDILNDETCFAKVKMPDDTEVNLNSMLRGVRISLSGVGTDSLPSIPPSLLLRRCTR